MLKKTSIFVLICMSTVLFGGIGDKYEKRANLIRNGCFKNMAGWDISDPLLVSIAKNKIDKRNCLELRADSDTRNGDASTSVSQVQNINSFTPDGEYRLELSVCADAFPREYSVSLMLPGRSRPYVIKPKWRQLGTSWQFVSIDFQDMDPLARKVVLKIQIKAPGTIWIDNVQITKLPKGSIGAEERELKNLPKFKGSPEYVQITPDRRFLVKGKPFFPIGMWGINFASEKMMTDARDYGLNVIGTGHFINLGAAKTRAHLNLAQSHGLMVVGVVRFSSATKMKGNTAQVLSGIERTKEKFKPILEVTKVHPAMLAYDIGDEVIWGGYNMSGFSASAHWIRENDPNHPLFANQAPRQSVELFKRWYRFADIGGSDIYPWWGNINTPDQHSDLLNKTISVVGDECIKNQKSVGNEKPVLMTLQAFGWSEGTKHKSLFGKGYSYPPEKIQRFMAYDAIVNGASGVLFFQDMRYRGMINPKIKPVSLELKSLHDVLASETKKYGVKSLDSRVKLITKRFNKNLYIIAVNRSKEPVTANITVPKGEWRSVHGDSKILNSQNGTLTLRFEPYDVKISSNGKQ